MIHMQHVLTWLSDCSTYQKLHLNIVINHIKTIHLIDIIHIYAWNIEKVALNLKTKKNIQSRKSMYSVFIATIINAFIIVCRHHL